MNPSFYSVTVKSLEQRLKMHGCIIKLMHSEYLMSIICGLLNVSSLLILLSIIAPVNPICLSWSTQGLCVKIYIQGVRVCFMLYFYAPVHLGYLFCFLMHDIKWNFAHPGVSLTRHKFPASIICISSLLDFYLHGQK